VSTIQQQQLLQGDLEAAFHQNRQCSRWSLRDLFQHGGKYGKEALHYSALMSLEYRTNSSSLHHQSQPIRGDVVSQVLDVIGELRLERISPDQWSDVTFISELLARYLKPFLPFVSPSLLQCAGSKNLSCQTFQHM